MARVSGTASLGVRRSLGHKKGWGSHDGASPHYSMTIERDDLSNDLTDEQLSEKAEELTKIAQKRVEKLIADDLTDLNKVDD